MFQLHTNFNIKYTVLNQGKLHKYRIWPCNSHCKTESMTSNGQIKEESIILVSLFTGSDQLLFYKLLNVCSSVWVSWNHLLVRQLKKKLEQGFSSSSWIKIIRYSHTEKVAKYSTNLLTGKLNLKENLLLTFLVQVLINGQDQQRTQRFFALATADIYIDTRQGGMRQVLHYITCASLRWKTKVTR